MSETRFVTTGSGSILGVYSWTEGFKPLKPPKKLWPDSDAHRARKKAKPKKHCENVFSSKRRD